MSAWRTQVEVAASEAPTLTDSPFRLLTTKLPNLMYFLLSTYKGKEQTI